MSTLASMYAQGSRMLIKCLGEDVHSAAQSALLCQFRNTRRPLCAMLCICLLTWQTYNSQEIVHTPQTCLSLASSAGAFLEYHFGRCVKACCCWSHPEDFDHPRSQPCLAYLALHPPSPVMYTACTPLKGVLSHDAAPC